MNDVIWRRQIWFDAHIFQKSVWLNRRRGKTWKTYWDNFYLYEEGDSCSSPAMCNENVSLQKGMLPVIQGTMTNYIVIKCTVIAWRIMFLANWSTSLCCSFPYIEPLLLHCIIYFIILIWTCVTFQFSSIFRSRLFFTSPSSATLRKVYFRML